MGWLTDLFSFSRTDKKTFDERLTDARADLGKRIEATVNPALSADDRLKNFRDISMIADRFPAMAKEVVAALRAAKTDPVEEVRTGTVIFLGLMAERHDSVRHDILLALGHIGTATFSYGRDHTISQAARIATLRPDLTDTALTVIRAAGFGTNADEGNRAKALNVMGSLLARPLPQRDALIAASMPSFQSASTDMHPQVRALADEWMDRLRALPPQPEPEPPSPAP